MSPERALSKPELIQAILCLIPDASAAHLATRTVSQLRETLARWRATEATTEREIARHCSTDFLPR